MISILGKLKKAKVTSILVWREYILMLLELNRRNIRYQ
jgi:hypothetical protein